MVNIDQLFRICMNIERKLANPKATMAFEMDIQYNTLHTYIAMVLYIRTHTHARTHLELKQVKMKNGMQMNGGDSLTQVH